MRPEVTGGDVQVHVHVQNAGGHDCTAEHGQVRAAPMRIREWEEHDAESKEIEHAQLERQGCHEHRGRYDERHVTYQGTTRGVAHLDVQWDTP